MVERRWPTCISLAMLGEEKSTTTWSEPTDGHTTEGEETIRAGGAGGASLPASTVMWWWSHTQRQFLSLLMLYSCSIHLDLPSGYMWECDWPSSWRPEAGASLRWPAGCSTVWRQTASSGGCWWTLKTRRHERMNHRQTTERVSEDGLHY